MLLLITYLAERSAVFAVAVGCRPLPRCSRCGCPAECYDRCHCSSPNLRTRPQDTSITTHVPAGGLSTLMRSLNIVLSPRSFVFPCLFALNQRESLSSSRYALIACVSCTYIANLSIYLSYRLQVFNYQSVNLSKRNRDESISYVRDLCTLC